MKIATIISNVYLYFRATHGVDQSIRLASEATGVSFDEVKRVLGFDGYETSEL